MKLFSSCLLLLVCVTHAEHDLRPKRCLKPPVLGICRPFNKVYYFDYDSYKCRKLKWGICIGGNNHFPTQDQCQETCIRREGRKSRSCLEKAETCSCTPQMRSWYFDAKSNHCKMFNHTECAGGSNRFETEKKCMELCQPMTKPTKQKAVCSEDPKPGWWWCWFKKTKWYFDVQANTCRQFEGRKCGKGANGFPSFEACMERCSYTGCQRCKNGTPYYYPNGTSPCEVVPK
ncbi:boophilin-G2-like [Dermacentor variabilis]|uniref:boophilin-G2-like n=1 Tax=Dermacentor variabilis TaxID=34621 RepID=UPI003F5B8152